MENLNVKPSDRAPLVGVINPQSVAAVQTSDWVDMSLFPGGILATVIVGDIAGGGTVNAKLQQATSSAGAGAKDITGKAITALTAAGADDNKQAEINCLQEDLDVANSFRYARLSITPDAATLICGTIRGFSAAYGPASDLSSVDEVVG